MLAPELEARYKLINKILDKLNISQVLELASGYTSRGVRYSKKEYNYIEMDLENVSKNKINILKSINNFIPDNLHIISGNALRKNAFDKCKKNLKVSEPVAVINEGLLRYLTFEEKRIVAKMYIIYYQNLVEYGLLEMLHLRNLYRIKIKTCLILIKS